VQFEQRAFDKRFSVFLNLQDLVKEFSAPPTPWIKSADTLLAVENETPTRIVHG
jgi:hypothetical protein